jgi:NAD(P)-dependent dehydrogenase (short-subunit alcohol dehydrogenase family)
MPDNGSLTGRVALVTGGARGIGHAIVCALQREGARVAAADLAFDGAGTAAGGAAAEESLRAPEQYVVDLAQPDQAISLPARVASDLGRLDIVVNNAGRRGIFDFADYPLDDWNATLAVNLTAPFLISREASRFMVAQGGGSIVNITSVAAHLGFSRRSAYNVSKAGLTGLTKSIALELGGSGVRCNAVAPGIVETSLNAAYLRDAPESEAIVTGTPVGHWGQPADIAAAVIFLCSPAAEFVNGAVIKVDGGWTAGKGY